MEKKFGVQGCAGGCSMGNSTETFGSVMQKRMGVGATDDDRENYAFICAAGREPASGWDDARFNQELEKCRQEYDAMGGNYPVDIPDNVDIPQGYDPTLACTSTPVIAYVQMMTGNPNTDGSWGPESQKYLDASGKTFMEIANEAGGCVGPAPVYVEPGNGNGGGNTDVVIDVTTGKKQGWLDIPWWAWALIGVGALGLGVGGVYLATRDKEEEEGMAGRPAALAGAEPKPKFIKKRAAAKRARSMKRDSKGRFLPKKMSYKRR